MKVRVERWPLHIPGEGQKTRCLEVHAENAVRGVGVLEHVHLSDLTGQCASEHDVIAVRGSKIAEERERSGRIPIGDEKKIQIDPVG